MAKEPLANVKSLIRNQGFKILQILSGRPDRIGFDIIGFTRFFAPKREKILPTACHGNIRFADEDIQAAGEFANEIEKSPEGEREYFRPVKRCVLDLDIVEFTKREMVEQVLVISALHRAFLDAEESPSVELPEIKIPTGDGCILVFQHTHDALTYAAAIAQWTEEFNRTAKWGKLHFRMGMDLGPVQWVRDLRGNWNYVGDAINNANRVRSTIGDDMDDVIYVSYNVYEATLGSAKAFLFPMGRRRDKHGEMHRVFHYNYHAQVIFAFGFEEELKRIEEQLDGELDWDPTSEVAVY